MRFLSAHSTLIVLALYWIFSAAVSAMPTPGEKSSTFYNWSFAFLHTLAGSIGRVMSSKFPSNNRGESKEGG